MPPSGALSDCVSFLVSFVPIWMQMYHFTCIEINTSKRKVLKICPIYTVTSHGLQDALLVSNYINICAKDLRSDRNIFLTLRFLQVKERMENELGLQKMKKSRYIAIRISYRDTILISRVLRYIDISIYCDTPNFKYQKLFF